MTRFLSLAEVLSLHRQVVAQSGGSPGLHDVGALASSLAQPHMTFGGQDFYPGLVEKASALGFSLILIILAMLFGALVASVFFSVGHWGTMPTRLTYDPVTVPLLMRIVMGVMAIFVLVTGAMDAIAATRLAKEMTEAK